jgi:hypothetical protein
MDVINGLVLRTNTIILKRVSKLQRRMAWVGVGKTAYPQTTQEKLTE